MVDDDTNEEWDIFVHDRQTDLTERVSIDSFGNQANNWNGVTAISSDGRYVTFVSDADNLVSNDSNGQRDALSMIERRVLLNGSVPTAVVPKLMV